MIQEYEKLISWIEGHVEAMIIFNGNCTEADYFMGIRKKIKEVKEKIESPPLPDANSVA